MFALDNYEFWGPVFNFLVFLFLITFFGGPRIRSYLVSRRQQIAGDLAEAQRLREEAQAKHDEFTQRLAQLDQEMEQIRQEMVKAGEAERDRIVAEAEAKSARVRRETRFVIEQQMKQLREDLTREAVEAAVGAADQALREKITSADQERLAKQYLETLRRHAGSPAGTVGGGATTTATAVAKGGGA
jgi:F-type H+-transporting ATPase subunit b